MNNEFNPETATNETKAPVVEAPASSQAEGASFPGADAGVPHEDFVMPDESGLFSENKLARRNGLSATVKISDWMKADCLSFLNFIPVFGSIIAIVIYCILAFSSKTAKSLKNRYIADLIWAAIALGLSILFMILVFVVVVPAVAPILESLFEQLKSGLPPFEY